jgi:hypothetical protein
MQIGIKDVPLWRKFLRLCAWCGARIPPVVNFWFFWSMGN